MRRFLVNFLKFAAPAALLCLGANAKATFVTDLYNTGTTTSTTSGSALAAPGTVDPHYAVTSTTYPGVSSVYVDTVLPFGYVPNTSTSQWIGPGPGGNGLTNYPLGTITLTTTFTIGSPFFQASIAGAVASDDEVTILLNGHTILANTIGYSAFTSFSDSTASDFVLGTNTLTYVVTNLFVNTPTNLQVTGLVGTFSAVPEPASVVLMGLGGLAAFGFARARRARVA